MLPKNRFLQKVPNKELLSHLSVLPKIDNLEPKPENEWESFAAFNPAAFIENGIIHLLYRAQGNNGLSVVGYAQSNDGYTINHREDYPAYVPRETFEGGFGIPDAKNVVQSDTSAGGYGGCEDPKVMYYLKIVSI